MPAILPAAALLLLTAAFRVLGNVSDEGRPTGWRDSSLQAAVVWGLAVVAITEISSFFHQLTPGVIGVGWLLLCVCAGAVFLQLRARLPADSRQSAESRGSVTNTRRQHKKSSSKHSRTRKPFSARHRFDPDVIAILLGVTIVVGVIFAIAIVSPPNTWD
jgi:hypothetical protein